MRGGRLPIHLAIIKGASHEIIQYLCQARPQALHKADEELNYPLHYAAMYGSSSLVRLLVQAYPQACRVTNGRDRLPLHLLCARCFVSDADTVTPQDLQLVLDAFPEAAQACDRFGRMPLHLAAQIQHQQWSFLDTLIRHYPEALVHKDFSRKTPLLLAKGSTRNPSHHDLVVTCLTECTLRERRKQNPYLPPFLLMNARMHVTKKNRKNVDLYNCYG
jgi:ankyrin repeat protein